MNQSQKICKALGPIVSREPCPCGAIVDMHHCNLHNQTCVRTQYAWEQSFDHRSSVFDPDPDSGRYSGSDHLRLVKICEKCIQNTAKSM